jgi:hypothetical protein
MKGMPSLTALYEAFGFQLFGESEGTQEGTKVVEQRFSRRFA